VDGELVIAAVIALGAVAVVLVGVLAVMLRTQAAERHEWVDERRSLVDRAIASHVGEVVALDRTAQRPQRVPTERPEAVGLG
jgi:hypothetical protein